MSKVVKTTEANASQLRAIVDQAYGYPSAGVPGPTLVARTIKPTWDGQGEAPFGWTKTQCAEYSKGASDSWLALDDETAAKVAASKDVSAPDKARVASATRVEEPDPTEGGTRTPKASAVAVVEAVTAEEIKP